MGERRGTKALETWCRRVTQGYPGVKVDNMTTSWRDGLAFCALIHHFRPDLIDFARLDKSDVYGNNELAFRIAERHLGIPALLDAEDMAEYPVPDRLSILTYLSQFYQAFASNSSSPVKKASSDSPDGSLVSLVQGNVQPQPKLEWSSRGREPCVVCKLPVFIAQRLRVGGRLYHRTCFRCGRCAAQLSPADCYETCAGEWVCETCPDEMAASEEPELPRTPPPLPPDPPPSLVAARRLMFDTDDAKLMKQDHAAVNTARLVHSIKKDLSPSVDICSPIDAERINSVNNTIDKNSSSNPEVGDSIKPSQQLVQCVNNSTIPASSNHSEPAKDSISEKTSPPIIEKEDERIKLVEETPLDISKGTPSFNDTGNVLNVDRLSLHSENNAVEKTSRDAELDLNVKEIRDDVEKITSSIENPEITEVVHQELESSVDHPDSIVGLDSSSECPNQQLSSSIEHTNPEVDLSIEQTNQESGYSMDHSNQPLDSSVERPNQQLDSSVEHQPLKDLGKPIESQSNSGNASAITKEEYPDDLNPFGDSGEEEDVKKEPHESTNPFGSDSEDEEPVTPAKPPPKVTPRKSSLGTKSTASTNPFGSDEDDDEPSTPQALPRTSFQSSPEPTPFPRRSRLRTSARSITSLSSIGSYSSTSPRKKKPAPPPPVPQTPPPAYLSPSSRQPSMTSLASIRSRKTKRAPLPPSPALGLPKPPPTVDTPPKAGLLSNDAKTPKPVLEVTAPSLSEETSSDMAGEIMTQIEEGMKKLISDHEELEVNKNVPFSSKEEKDTINENSKAGVSFIEEDITSNNVEVKTVESKQDNEEMTSIDVENEINTSDFLEKIVEIKNPVIVKKEEHSNLEDNVSCDKVIDCFDEIDLDNKTGPTIEAFNEELLSSTRNSSEFKFDEMAPSVHSTPVKIIPSASMLESSQEDLASGNSLSGTPYFSSPSASLADISSCQESLASPPTEKKIKDSANMHKKITESGVYLPHKSVYGQWKRKKGPAPALPIPQRRNVKPMAMNRIRQELSDIEIKQQELERQGVGLEQKIREKFDSEANITPYLEELVLQLFELVNEKNELFRKQAELMYIRRQHQLEEEHAELEYQIRCLMARPELNKTDSDKELEEKLIQRLVEVVERRDAIVQCLEMDRLREVEEDKSITRQLDKFTKAIVTDDRMKIKKRHKKKKEKHSTLKMLDLDKDFDESEKESKKKKKWYTLQHKRPKDL